MGQSVPIKDDFYFRLLKAVVTHRIFSKKDIPPLYSPIFILELCPYFSRKLLYYTEFYRRK